MLCANVQFWLLVSRERSLLPHRAAPLSRRGCKTTPARRASSSFDHTYLMVYTVISRIATFIVSIYTHCLHVFDFLVLVAAYFITVIQIFITLTVTYHIPLVIFVFH